ncbi:hypothetical protein [Legionella cardiaca]|uniref:Uncharacterized protein n=1 Tax=Legionella cardiaca TaxID=1071983 RepID=A0ABY8ASH6_9GAMM|nr:hypothetical protein [Legionella cardiaca]WED42127.1 hypothetical protein PXX05_09320 [Legionella cardiaca]
MPLFFKKKALVNPVLIEKLMVEHPDKSFATFINSYGENPAQSPELQSHSGFLLDALLKQKKNPFIKIFLENLEINNPHQFITVEVYRKMIATGDRELIACCNKVLKNCSSEKHKALVLYPLTTDLLNQALSQFDAGLHEKVMRAWKNVNLDELVSLNLFLQLNPNNRDIAHYFKGGLFAVQDGGALKKFFQNNLAVRDRSHNCSHVSITPVHSTQGEFIPEFLFGDRNITFVGEKQRYNRDELTVDSFSWFQTEYASIFGESVWKKIINYIVHNVCFVIYWLTNKNVGPYGMSEYREKNIRILDGAATNNYAVAVDEVHLQQINPVK